MIRRPPRSTPLYSSAASDVYKRQRVDAAEPVRRRADLARDRIRELAPDATRVDDARGDASGHDDDGGDTRRPLDGATPIPPERSPGLEPRQSLCRRGHEDGSGEEDE